MATVSITLQGFSAAFHSRPSASSVPSSQLNPYVVSHTLKFPRSCSLRRSTLQGNKHLHFPGASASSEGLPTELVEDSKFVPLNADDPQYGPPALLLLGFDLEEAEKIQQFLKDMDGEFLQVIYCTDDMINRSLWDAVNTKQQDLKSLKTAKSLPRICFVSGLTGEETMMFIDAFEESGLEPAVFAALVPNSADKPLQELIEEVMGDHEALSGQQPG